MVWARQGQNMTDILGSPGTNVEKSKFKTRTSWKRRNVRLDEKRETRTEERENTRKAEEMRRSTRK